MERFLDPRWWHRNLSTFQKVVVANSAIIVAGAVGGPLIAIGASRNRLPILILFSLFGLLAILFVNYLILRLAFRPLRELESTMTAVQRGTREPRAPADFADPDVRRMATVFNSMLDRIEQERHLTAQRVLQAQERERQRVARELHDQTGQALTHEIISLDLLLEKTSDPDTRRHLEAVKRTLEETLEEVHRMSQDLRPSVLDDLGLVPALRTLARQRSGAAVSVRVEGVRDRFPPPIETALYRIAQEAVTNANKYSRAQRIAIELRCRDHTVELRVRDDGIGFDPAAIRDQAGRTGLGLFGMRERASLLHGTLDVRSRPSRGTEIVAELPLEGLNGH